MKSIRAFAVIGAFTSLLSAQNKGVINPQYVPSSMMYHRVWIASPLVGTGKPGDPKRPMFVPAPPQPAKKGAPVGTPTATDRSGVLGFQMQFSDDGTSALVELVVASPAVFQALLQAEATARGVSVSSNLTQNTPAPLHAGLAAPSATQAALETAVPGLKIFERGKATDSDILAEFRKHRANYTFDSASVRPQ